MNVTQQSNSQPLESKLSRPKGNYTGERLLRERPRVYRQVVELLAEPREQMSIREICRRCHVTDDTVKAVEKREAIPIAARKQALLSLAANVAQVAAERMEELAGQASLREASVTFGIATEKLLLLSGDPTSHSFNLSVYAKPVDLTALLNKLHAEILANVKEVRKEEKARITLPQLTPPSCEMISDSDGEIGLEPSDKRLKTS